MKKPKCLTLDDLRPYLEDSILFYVCISNPSDGFYGIATHALAAEARGPAHVAAFTLKMRRLIRIQDDKLVEGSAKEDYDLHCTGESIKVIEQNDEHVLMDTGQEKILLSFNNEPDPYEFIRSQR